MCFVNCSFISLLLFLPQTIGARLNRGYEVLDVRRTTGRHELNQATSPFSLSMHIDDS